MRNFRYIVIGDVHGMLPELQDLLAKVEMRTTDVLVFCGDLVDKGPDSVGVVKYVRRLAQTGQSVVLVLGNHEEKHARYRKAVLKSGGKQPEMKGVEEMATITAGLLSEDIEFLESAVPFYILRDLDAMVVHGGIPTTVTDLKAVDKGDLAKMCRLRYITGSRKVTLTVELPWNTQWGTEPEAGEAFPFEGHFDGAVLKKVVRPEGDFLQLGVEGPHDPFWADRYDGRFGHVYFGHEPFTDAFVPVAFKHATGMDLGAVFGGHLACAVLEEGCQPRYASVKASGIFCNKMEE